MSDLASIRLSFDSDIAVSIDRFDKKLSSLVDSLIKQVNLVPYEPLTSTDVFDKVIPAFSLGVGDSKSGVYGDFVVDLTKSIDTASQGINRYVAGSIISTQQAMDVIQLQIASLSEHISIVANDANTKVSSLLTSANTRFSSALETSQLKAASFYINSLADSYIGAINRADEIVVNDMDKLKQLYTTYQMIPSGFYNDLNTILTEISTAYNDSIDKANSVYNDGIALYKYYSTASSDQLVSSQNKIKSVIDVSTAKVSGLLSSVPALFVNKADYAFAIAIAMFSSKMFDESIRIRNNLENFISDLAKRAEVTMRSIDLYYKRGYSPIFVDGVDYRNRKSSVVNGANNMVSTTINKIFEDYNARTEVISTNYSTYLTTVQESIIDFINNNVDGLSEEQLASIDIKLSNTVTRYNDRVSVYFTIYSKYINYISDGLMSRLDKMNKKYYGMPPLIRFTGKISSPSGISNKDSHLDVNGLIVYHNGFMFGVQNIGGSMWSGWFGVRLTSSVDAAAYAAAYTEDTGDVFTGVYDRPYFKWNKRKGLDFIAPNQIKEFTVVVPGKSIYNIKELGSNVIPSIVTNTYRGAVK
jgi:hypothetical protein